MCELAGIGLQENYIGTIISWKWNIKLPKSRSIFIKCIFLYNYFFIYFICQILLV